MNCPGETKRSQAGPLEAKCIIGTLEKRSRKEVAIPLPIPKSLDSLPPSHRMFPIPLSPISKLSPLWTSQTLLSSQFLYSPEDAVVFPQNQGFAM